MALPPFELGAVHVKATEALPALASTSVGAPGGVTRDCRPGSTPGVLSDEVLVPVVNDAPAVEDATMGTIESTNMVAAPTALNVMNRDSRRRATRRRAAVRLIRSLNDMSPSAATMGVHPPPNRAGNNARQCSRRPP